MRVRTFGLSILALGILIGAGGCSADSPTSPLAPTSASADKSGVPNAAVPGDSTSTVQGGFLSAGGRQPSTGGGTVQAAGGFLSAGG